SAALIVAGVERLGTQRATWSDWPSLIGNIAWRRTVAILLFAVLLGVTVHWVRVEMLRRKHREIVEGAAGLRPPGVDNQQVQGGRIMATGPGLPMPDPGDPTDEPWRTGPRETRFLPMQAR